MTDDRKLKWLEIDNFGLGIVSNSARALPQGPPVSSTPAPVPAGVASGQNAFSAQQLGTWGCKALPNGAGLAPLPSQDTTATYSSLSSNTNGTWIVGAFVYGPTNVSQGGTGLPDYDTGTDELFVGFDTIATDLHKTFTAGYHQTTLGSFTVIKTIGPTACALNIGVSYLSGGFTQLQAVAGTPIDVSAVLALGYTQFNNGNPIGWTAVYNDPTTGSDAFLAITGVPAPTACLTHQNRIIWLVGQTIPWTPALGGMFAQAEQFAYTDPPGDTTIGGSIPSGFEYFIAEHPFQHGAWGSVSAGELFLVRHHGGGYIISNDLNNPTVTRLFGVTPTNGACQRAGETPIGLVYASQNNGMWAWNGGSNSVKISTQLNDNFFQPPGVTAPGISGALASSGPQWSIDALGSLVFCPNNWVYDCDTQSWWILDNPSTTPTYIWFGSSYDGLGMWAFPQFVPHGSSTYAHHYSITKPAHEYQWSSNPIRLPSDTKNAELKIREIVVRQQGVGEVIVTITGLNGSINNSSSSSPNNILTVNSNTQPVMSRMTVGQSSGGPLSAQDIIVSIDAIGESIPSVLQAPVVYSVAIGYEEAEAPVRPT